MSSHRPRPDSEKKNDNSMLLALVLFLGAGGLIFFSMMPEEKAKNSPTIVHSKKYEDSVNKHLMLTNEKIQLQKQRMMVENNALAPEYQRTRPGQAYENSNVGVDLTPENRSYEVAKALGREERPESQPRTPHEIIQSEVFNQQQEQEYSRAYKEEYAKQFIANAARNGWAVKLSDDFKVLSVTPIRAPTNQMQLFNSDGRSGQ